MGDRLRPARCTYSASGHMKHPIQYKLALRRSSPRVLELIGPHDQGWVLASTDSSGTLEVWSMHQEWRDLLATAFEIRETRVTAWDYGLARVGDEYLSYCPPHAYRECPAHDEMTPLMSGFFTREQLSEGTVSRATHSDEHNERRRGGESQ